ncbi:MAG: carbamoyltransferase HypF [Lachnospiraceae bacterium]|nr:carbamoyltransferase HypF [Lachnospiraceae bacterium]
MDNKRLKIRAYGIVQGIGFRPFVSRLAAELHLAGDVANKGSYVEIHVEGKCSDVDRFREDLVARAPAVAAIVRVEDTPEELTGSTMFRIIGSTHVEGEIFVSPDLAICPDCKRELFDPADKRYLHPFINCTNCGPRLTILDGVPYDRVRTSMGVFPMCPDCEFEYTHPETRRYHAQPVCCNDCGPRVYVLRTDEVFGGDAAAAAQEAIGRPIGLLPWGHSVEEESLVTKHEMDGDAIMYVRRVIRNGGSAAVKGIGGFHLCCDATCDEAVARLRELKHRPMKPFAVMMKNLETVRRECIVPAEAEKILDGVQKPIVILDRVTRLDQAARLDGVTQLDQAARLDPVTRKEPSPTRERLSSLVAPDNPTVGVMLPYAPVQLLIFDYPDGEPFTDALIMTSGNPSGAPICKDDEDAIRYLSPMCDVILSNDRLIRLRADDSVMQMVPVEDLVKVPDLSTESDEKAAAKREGGQPVKMKPYMIRRSRGYAPLPFLGPAGFKGQVLAAGGELKNTFCLAKDELYYPSPYIGDLADLRSVKALEAAVTRMEELLETKPELVVCDMHPRYNSSAFAEEIGLPVKKIQHHYAHVLSCMAENGVTEKVIGISLDGTGYGTDGTIWGGEVLLAGPDAFERVGMLKPFVQAGGDLASKEGWRIALSLIYDATGSREETLAAARGLELAPEKDLKMQMLMIEKRLNAVTSTSAGRLFDGVSALLGIRSASTFEGEASMALEFAAERWLAEHEDFVSQDFEQIHSDAMESRNGSAASDTPQVEILHDNDILELDYKPLIISIMNGIRNGESRDRLAYMFHEYLAHGMCRIAFETREKTGVNIVALSGGCFQNLLLLRLCREELAVEGFRVLTHSLVPPNDGGIGLGQAFYGMWSLNKEQNL